MSGSVVLLAKRKFNPRAMFSQSEQGLWLDPSDMNATKARWRRNLLTYSEQFDVTTGGWSKAGTSVTSNTDVAPDGQTTADTILTTVGVANPGVYQNINYVAGQQYTFSVWLKAGTISTTRINCWGPGVGVFSYVDTVLTGEWQRFTHTFTSPVTGAGLYSISPEGFITGTGKTIKVWGAQLELGSTPTEYQRITDFSTEFKAAFPTHTLYQDSNGVTPCTAAGDPVGLVLDQSRGGLANLGPEIVTNGGLSNATGWTVSGASPPSITGGQAVWSNSTGEIGWISPLTVGKWYKLEFDLVSYTSGNLAFRDGTTNTSIATAGAVAGRKTFLINATSTQIRFISFASATVTIDNISVREVPGNHAYQSTSGARPTLARIPSSGRRNLLTRSEEFDNAAWSKALVTVTANTDIAPDGTQTAETVTTSVSAGNPNASQTVSLVSGQQYSFSLYIKAGTNTSCMLNVWGPGVGVFANQTFTGLSSSWTRCVFTFTSTVTSASCIISISPEGLNAGTGKSIVVWGAQLETGSSATNYQKVVATSDVTESGFNDLWHLVFDGSDDSLVTNAIDFNAWTQETRRNLLLATEDFSNATWIKTNLGVSGNTMTPDATLGQHRIYQQVTHTSPHVFSVEAKANGYNFISLAYAGGLSGQSIFFDLSNGTISGSLANFTPTITSMGDGWYRCSLAYSATIASSAINHFVFIRNAASIADYSGDGVSGVLLRYPQLEQGSTLTDYQRVGTDEMTVIAGVRKLSDALGTVFCELSVSVSSNNGTFVLLAPNQINATKYVWVAKGTSLVEVETTAAAPTTNVLTCLADISAPSTQLRNNGSVAQTKTDTLGTGNFGNYQLFIGRRNNATVPYNGHLYQLIIRGKTTPTGKLLEAEKFVSKKTGVNL